jgi:hypothetical protein
LKQQQFAVRQKSAQKRGRKRTGQERKCLFEWIQRFRAFSGIAIQPAGKMNCLPGLMIRQPAA